MSASRVLLAVTLPLLLPAAYCLWPRRVRFRALGVPFIGRVAPAPRVGVALVITAAVLALVAGMLLLLGGAW